MNDHTTDFTTTLERSLVAGIGHHDRRVRRNRIVAGAAGLVLVVGAAVAAFGVDEPRQTGIADDGTSGQVDRPTPHPDGPSQSPADAARDGVEPAVAGLPFAERVTAVAVAADDDERWIASRLPNGEYGAYGEILLVAADEDRIIRAFPLPGLPPQEVVVANDAVFCGRQGDGGTPHSMLCRVDRATFARVVRVFPHPGTGYEAPEPDWIVEEPTLLDGFEGLEVNGAVVTTRRHHIHPDTLALAATVAPEDQALVDAWIDFATGSAPPPLSGQRAAVAIGLGTDLDRSVVPTELATIDDFVIDEQYFAGYEGPFNVIASLARLTDGSYEVTVGAHPHCAGPPRDAPPTYEQLRRVSVQPTGIDSCLQWFTVDFFVDPDGAVRAITLDLWEP